MSRFSMLIVAGCVVAGSWSPACSRAEDKIIYIDLEPQANRKLSDNQGRGLDGNDLNNVPTGEQKFGDLTFKIGPKLIQLGSQMLDSLPATVEGITVKKKLTKLYILHATCFGGGPNEPGGIGYVKDGTPIGEYVVHYKDKTIERIPIVYGEEVRDWFFAEGEAEPSKSKIVWTGDNEFATDVGCRLRLYATTWTNPKPNEKVISIDFVGRKTETPCAPVCLAMTAVKEKRTGAKDK